MFNYFIKEVQAVNTFFSYGLASILATIGLSVYFLILLASYLSHHI